MTEAWVCPVCRRTLHPRSACDKARHNGTTVHERALRTLDLYHAFLAGTIPPMVGANR